MEKTNFFLLLLMQLLFLSAYAKEAPMICEVNVTSSNTEILITGLTGAENVKLFDETVSGDAIVWECNPWNDNVCTGDELITNLTPGATYFLSVQSDECNEFITINIEDEEEETPLGCAVELSVVGNEVTIAGLTADANSKIFDENFSVVWSCDPWTGSGTIMTGSGSTVTGSGSICQPNSIIDNLIIGKTYYLSVVSDLCEEWIPFTIGAPAECTATASYSNGEITMTGLTSDMSVALFDNDANLVFKCKPGGLFICSDTEVISNLNNGATYYLSISSNTCDEWIPITIEQTGTAQECEVELESFTTVCTRTNDDGSFSAVSLNTPSGAVQTNYAADGSVISTGLIEVASGIDLNGSMIFDFISVGNTRTIQIDAEIASLYSTGNNQLLPVAVKNANNEYFIVGRIVSSEVPVPPSSGVIPDQASDKLIIYRLDENGNHINHREFATLNWSAADYEQNLEDQIENFAIIPRADGGVDLLLGQVLASSPSSLLPTTQFFKYEIDTDFTSVVNTPLGVSGAEKFDIFTIQFSACDLVIITTVEEEIINNEEIRNSTAREFWDYMVSPPKLLYTTYETVSTNSSTSTVATERGIFTTLSPGIEARAFQTFYSSTSLSSVSYNNTDEQPVLVLADAWTNEIISEETLLGIPSVLIPINGGASLNYVVGSTLHIGDCEEPTSPQITDKEKDRFTLTKLFPNPTTDEAILQIESVNDQQVSLLVYDVVGKLQLSRSVQLEMGHNNLIVNFSELKAGMYNVMILDDGNQLQSTRLVKVSL